MKTIQAILAKKSKDIISVSPETSVFVALQIMMENNISALLVLANGQLAGIFTERDYARKVILQGRSSKETPISMVMTAQPLCIGLDETVNACMALMTERHFRHLPVVQGGQLIGIISIGDLVKYIMEDQKQTISQLESYINS
jgi:CBS domain-containing protein